LCHVEEVINKDDVSIEPDHPPVPEFSGIHIETAHKFASMRLVQELKTFSHS